MKSTHGVAIINHPAQKKQLLLLPRFLCDGLKRARKTSRRIEVIDSEQTSLRLFLPGLAKYFYKAASSPMRLVLFARSAAGSIEVVLRLVWRVPAHCLECL